MLLHDAASQLERRRDLALLLGEVAGQDREALDLIDRALGFRPEYVEALTNRAVVLILSTSPRKSGNCFREGEAPAEP